MFTGRKFPIEERLDGSSQNIDQVQGYVRRNSKFQKEPIFRPGNASKSVRFPIVRSFRRIGCRKRFCDNRERRRPFRFVSVDAVPEGIEYGDIRRFQQLSGQAGMTRIVRGIPCALPAGKVQGELGLIAPEGSRAYRSLPMESHLIASRTQRVHPGGNSRR